MSTESSAPPQRTVLPKPAWIRVQAGGARTQYLEVKNLLRTNRLQTVCEQASCPNMGECFGLGTAAFLILGKVCTRRCPFCDVGHGRPQPPDPEEPQQLADAVVRLRLGYVVVTSVNRDDLPDAGAGHFVTCIKALRQTCPATRVEILTPDFRGKESDALAILGMALPDVMNHNLETVPRLYREVRPGARYEHSLRLLQDFGRRYPDVPTKSGLMLGLGETDEEVMQTMQDLRAHGVRMLTIGQYLAPSKDHLPVQRYVHPDTFRALEARAYELGFDHAAVGPMVRSSYHADAQARQVLPGCDHS
ncbi:lipoyl synthase [Candidatus Symbiobacter mobilis]|uniref:Lipoyl synthase n=1 Tax=Candidatus Symbiobacter mobilis CR TaxID=946483 RepID=U5NAW2_9BURK|nr:lipoyl synthase [Candidatus Symbiobacter mobilis]AGX88440.1 lipoic acid synthetase [Candidatus Symbiobacter mobilis CR]